MLDIVLKCANFVYIYFLCNPLLKKHFMQNTGLSNSFSKINKVYTL